MQDYTLQRSAEGSQSGVPSWLLEEQAQLQQQRQQMAAHTPRRNRNDSSTSGGASSPSYAGLSGSPDIRRTYYRSNQTSTLDRHQLRERRHQRQQQEQAMATQQRSTTGANMSNYREGVVTSNDVHLQTVASSEPIYLDIDPTIHHKYPTTVAGANAATGFPSRTQEGNVREDMGIRPSASGDSNFSTPSRPSSKSNKNSKSPSRLRALNCRAAAPTEVRPPSRASMSSNSNSHHSQQHFSNTSPSPLYVQNQSSAIENSGVYSMNMNIANNNSWQSRNSQHYTYVNPYVSSVAQQYRVPGGMFPNQPNHSFVNTSSSTTHSSQRPSPYDDLPIGPDKRGLQSHQESLIMFGDDYDLGSINTGMSQQELLKKRRDVKKRRDGKSSKKKKSHKKERIVNMPPRLLSMGSWDTSPITKLTSKDNSQHALYRDNIKEEQVSDPVCWL